MKITIFVMVLFITCSCVFAWTEYRITSSPSGQVSPMISGNIVVWSDNGGSPIRGADISTPNNPVYFNLPANPLDFGGAVVVYGYSKRCVMDQKYHSGILGYDITTKTEFIVKDSCPGSSGYANYNHPATDGLTVLFKRSCDCTDCPVFGYDLQWQSEFEITGSQVFAEPKVDGDTIVWLDCRDWKLHGFKLSTWQQFPITDSGYPFDVSGSFIVAQKASGSDVNIYGFNITDPCNPIEFGICTDANRQENPAISGNIVVWQDNRNGNWDIYGYDISTQTEFQITTNTADQLYPAINGHTVVWQDERHGQSDIYATILYGPEVPRCAEKLQGDLNNDCKVDLQDFAIFCQNWLDCNLDPPEACWE